MFTRITDFLKYTWNKTITFLGVLVIFLTAIDYFNKWQMASFVLVLFLGVVDFVTAYFLLIFIVLVLIWLSGLTLLYFQKASTKKLSPPSNQVFEEKLGKIKGVMAAELKAQIDVAKREIKTSIKVLDDRLFEAERTLVIFEIAEHLSKNQVGALKKMIEKLEMDLKRGWGVEDTLFEIKEYIKESGMPNYYLADLQKSLDRIPKEFEGIKEDILKLAREKFYKVV